MLNQYQTLSGQRATQLAGENPDYDTQELYNAIRDATNNPRQYKFPEWTVYIVSILFLVVYLNVTQPKQQTMSEEVSMKETYAPLAFDVTKVWPFGFFPLKEIGKITLNQNPENYFDEIEQVWWFACSFAL